MSTKEANIELISTLPDSDQEKIFVYLSENFCGDSPYKPMSKQEIYRELAEARECYTKGDYQDFDEALDDISRKYGL